VIRHTNRGRGEQGFAMVMVLMVIAVMLLGVFLLLNGIMSMDANTRNLGQKNLLHDASEAGLSVAINALDANTTATACTGGTLATTQYQYTCGIVNNFASGAAKTNVPDPADATRTLSIPGSTSLVWGKGAQTGSSRIAWSEEIVKPSANSISFPHAAIDAGSDIGANGNVHVIGDIYANHNISANGNDTLTGNSYAHGTDGWAGSQGVHSNQAVFALPTSAQVTAFAANAQTQTQGGVQHTPAQFIGQSSWPGNVYVTGPVTMNGNGSISVGGTLYINGDLSINGNETLNLTGGATVYVKGNLTVNGNSNLTNSAGSTIVVTGNSSLNGNYTATTGTLLTLGNASLNGNGTNVGLLWAPNQTSLSINGNVGSGAIVVGNGDTCNYTTIPACGAVSLNGNVTVTYDSRAGSNLGSGFVTMLTYMEY
jgi:hypothetical protein